MFHTLFFGGGYNKTPSKYKGIQGTKCIFWTILAINSWGVCGYAGMPFINFRVSLSCTSFQHQLLASAVQLGNNLSPKGYNLTFSR